PAAVPGASALQEHCSSNKPHHVVCCGSPCGISAVVPMTRVVARRRLILSVAAVAVLAGALTATVFTSRASDWSSISLLGLLFVLATSSELLAFEVKGLRLSGSFLAIVLGMVLLGPAPAVALSVGCTLFDAVLKPRARLSLLINVSTSAVFAL